MIDNTNKIMINSISGSIAGISQLSSLYWLRTIIKYQYVYNTNLPHTTRILYYQPDRLRFFRGVIPNASKVGLGKIGEGGIITYFKPHNNIESILENSLYATMLISGWKLAIMPLDTIGNSYQVNGRDAQKIIKNKINRFGYSTLWTGSGAYLGITLLGSGIWISSYNYSNLKMPTYWNSDIRNGLIGFSATLISDTIVNPLRIIKTYKQSHQNNVSYSDAIKNIFVEKKDLLRGFKTRIVFNGFNSALYVILWKRLEKYFYSSF